MICSTWLPVQQFNVPFKYVQACWVLMPGWPGFWLHPCLYQFWNRWWTRALVKFGSFTKRAVCSHIPTFPRYEPVYHYYLQLYPLKECVSEYITQLRNDAIFNFSSTHSLLPLNQMLQLIADRFLPCRPLQTE